MELQMLNGGSSQYLDLVAGKFTAEAIDEGIAAMLNGADLRVQPAGTTAMVGKWCLDWRWAMAERHNGKYRLKFRCVQPVLA